MFWKTVLQSFFLRWRSHLGLMLGIAAAGAVLTGALLVGSSMRSSLRRLAVGRLERVEEILISHRYFRKALTKELSSNPEVNKAFDLFAGIIYLPDSRCELALNPEKKTFANQVSVIAFDSELQTFSRVTELRSLELKSNEIAINQALADELFITQESIDSGKAAITLRIPKRSTIPSDSPLGEKEDLVSSMPNLKVVAIIPNEGLGRFSLQVSQEPAKVLFATLESVQKELEKENQINTMVIGSSSNRVSSSQEDSKLLTKNLRPQLEDLGILLKHVVAPNSKGSTADSKPAFEYLSFASRDMVLADPLAERVEAEFASYNPRKVLTYLANDIGVAGETAAPQKIGIPFSMVTAIEFGTDFQPISALSNQPIQPLQENEIVLSEWAADDLQAQIGSKIRLSYFEPENAEGQTVERFTDFVLKDVAKVTKPSSMYTRSRAAGFETSPTIANDPDLTPEVPGVTDQDSIEKWDLPFTTAGRIRDKDDEYWQFYKTTPKAFVSPTVGDKLWGSRFGKITSIRFPVQGSQQAQALTSELVERLPEKLQPENSSLGFVFLPIKRQSIVASSGTTPFDGLFLGLSLFIIAAALVLVVLLFRLVVEKRIVEIGQMLAIGLRRKLVTRLLLAEAILVVFVGCFVGSLIGIFYAKLMVVGLQTWWVGAIRVPFIQFELDLPSVLLGAVINAAICCFTLIFVIWRLPLNQIRSMLQGKLPDRVSRSSKRSWGTVVGYGSIALAIALAFVATQLGGEAQAGSFLGSGFFVLFGLLSLLKRRLDIGKNTSSHVNASLWNLAWGNTTRNSSRAILTVGLIGVASFLIGGLSSFRLSPTDKGSGGFGLFASSNQPLFERWEDANGIPQGLRPFAGEMTVLPLRFRKGDDASCNNPYRTSRPRVMGITQKFVDYYDQAETKFEFAGNSPPPDEQAKKNPWRLLLAEGQGTAESPFPVVIDKNTAMYSLQIYLVGQTFSFEYEPGKPLHFKVVGFLANSVLQGSLLLGETNFERAFPEISGYQRFLIKTSKPENEEALAVALEGSFRDAGVDVKKSTAILEELLRVQNTYISAFQSLGAIGLLLGTFGLAAIQIRNVLEREAEFGLLRAIGFSKAKLKWMVVLESCVLLMLGLGIGTLAALLTVIPHSLVGEVHIPIGEYLGMIVLVGLIGVVVSLMTTRPVLSAEIVRALRRDTV